MLTAEVNMHRLNDLVEKLTPAQVKEVEEFAESLLQRAGHGNEAANNLGEQKKIRFGSWVGCMSHVEPEKSNKQIIREAWNEVIAKYER